MSGCGQFIVSRDGEASRITWRKKRLWRINMNQIYTCNYRDTILLYRLPIEISIRLLHSLRSCVAWKVKGRHHLLPRNLLLLCITPKHKLPFNVLSHLIEHNLVF